MRFGLEIVEGINFMVGKEIYRKYAVQLLTIHILRTSIRPLIVLSTLIYLPIHLALCLSIRLSTYLPTYLYINLPNYDMI